jgi:phosphoribosylformimino-5-aminoimidazole carboxamide ribotide isomerase
LLELYPAIDIRGGRCVRLQRGDFAAETVYDDDPVRVARAFENDGASWIHVVDLDAARTGRPENLSVVESICAAVSCRVQAGGGVRGIEAAGALLRAGAARVVVGTAAVEHPDLVRELATLHPGRVAVGLDARGRDVAVQGWTESTGYDVVELARRFGDTGASAVIVTEIGRDGTMDGPALDQLAAVLGAASLPVIASGGVGSLADVRELAQVRAGGRALAGVIVGRALYEGRFSIPEALEVVAATG